MSYSASCFNIVLFQKWCLFRYFHSKYRYFYGSSSHFSFYVSFVWSSLDFLSSTLYFPAQLVGGFLSDTGTYHRAEFTSTRPGTSHVYDYARPCWADFPWSVSPQQSFHSRVGIVSMPKRSALETYRRELPEDVLYRLVRIGTLLAVGCRAIELGKIGACEIYRRRRTRYQVIVAAAAAAAALCRTEVRSFLGARFLDNGEGAIH